ncbi:MAG: 50S ribosomal protein L23 [Candidatus Magasanikbacteria bacterium]|jgi:large subunit ribosomal protein L23|nr:50S ribosomal protein L23 [Candidatus Magasanikbacteria bacterium]
MAILKKDKKVEAEAPKTEKKAVQSSAAMAKRVLIRPMLSEKMSKQEAMGQYTFKVTRDATKIDVKNAVHALYGKMPAKVNIIHTDGKVVRFGRRTGRRSATKKAIVIMPKGQTISIHEGV